MDNNLVGYQLIVALINLITFVVIVYVMITFPVDLYRRLKRKLRKEAITPASLVAKKFFKYWGIAALFVIPFSATVTIYGGTLTGTATTEVIIAILTKSILGNVLTTAFIAYFFLHRRRTKWNNSISEEPAA